MKKRIPICINEGNSGSHAKEFFTFPLSDIFFSFYKTASIIEDFFHLNALKNYSPKYKTENKEFTIFSKNLIACILG